MSPQLRNLFIAVGVVTLAGVGTVAVYTLRPDATSADLDGGWRDLDCPRRVFECEGRLLCADGGPRIMTVDVPGKLCASEDGGGQELFVRLPRRGLRQCFELRGTVDTACRVLVGTSDGGCDDPTLCDADAPEEAASPAPSRCWCRQMDAGACRWLGGLDGGPIQMGRGDIHPGPVQGPACVRAPCGTFLGMADPLPPECE